MFVFCVFSICIQKMFIICNFTLISLSHLHHLCLSLVSALIQVSLSLSCRITIIAGLILSLVYLLSRHSDRYLYSSSILPTLLLLAPGQAAPCVPVRNVTPVGDGEGHPASSRFQVSIPRSPHHRCPANAGHL
jgi:hypothetical protein